MSKNKTVGCGCDYCMSRGVRRDFRQSHDGPEELPHRPKRGKVSVKHQGCEGNDGGAHVYVWIERIFTRKSWRDPSIDVEHTYYYKICIGCNKRGKSAWTRPHNIYQTIKENPWTVLL